MRKLIASEFMTLDGIMEDPGGAEGSKFGGWARANEPSEAFNTFKFNELMSSDALLLGKTTYDGFAKAWPQAQDTGEFGIKMNGMQKYVVSHETMTPSWQNTEVITGDIAKQIAKLKTAPGKDILLFGSGVLLQMLIAEQLVDELRLLIYPTVIGGGKQLFKEGEQASLKLSKAEPFDNGLVLLMYTFVK